MRRARDSRRKTKTIERRLWKLIEHTEGKEKEVIELKAELKRLKAELKRLRSNTNDEIYTLRERVSHLEATYLGGYRD